MELRCYHIYPLLYFLYNIKIQKSVDFEEGISFSPNVEPDASAVDEP